MTTPIAEPHDAVGQSREQSVERLATDAGALRDSRILACCGGMVVVYGLERMTFEVLRAARNAGATVHCVVNDWEQERIIEQAERIGASWSIGYHRYRIARSRNPLAIAGTLGSVLRTSIGFLRAARRVRPTHVLLPDYGAVAKNFPALLWLRSRGATTILRLGNAPPGGAFYSRFFRWIVDPAVGRYVCTSEYVRSRLLRHGIVAGKTEVIYNTLPSDRRALSATESGRRIEGRLIYVGQVIPEKNVHLVLDAVGLLRSGGRDVQLDVVGPMEGWVPENYAGYRERLVARSEKADLQGAVHFLGLRTDVMELLSAASLHVAPSSDEMAEGCPNVVLEAKAAGLPTVAFRVGPYPELVSHGETGWLCPTADAAALAARIDAILSDRDRLRRAGDAARRSLSQFSDERFRERWTAVLSRREVRSGWTR